MAEFLLFAILVSGWVRWGLEKKRVPVADTLSLTREYPEKEQPKPTRIKKFSLNVSA